MREIRNMSLVNLLLLVEERLEKWNNEYGEIESVEEALAILNDIGIDEIMELLGCSKRTAYDYKNTIKELVRIIRSSIGNWRYSL